MFNVKNCSISNKQISSAYVHMFNVENSSIFLLIQFSISTQFSSIGSSSIAGNSLSDCLVSYLGHSWSGDHTSQQRYSRCILQPQLTRPQDTHWGILTPLHRCSRCILLPQPTGQPGKDTEKTENTWKMWSSLDHSSVDID